MYTRVSLGIKAWTVMLSWKLVDKKNGHPLTSQHVNIRLGVKWPTIFEWLACSYSDVHVGYEHIGKGCFFTVDCPHGGAWQADPNKFLWPRDKNPAVRLTEHDPQFFTPSPQPSSLICPRPPFSYLSPYDSFHRPGDMQDFITALLWYVAERSEPVPSGT